MEFGKILKEKRKELGMTQEELAQQLNVTRSAISNWEIGRNYPDIQTIIDLSKILGVSLDYLLNEDFRVREAVDTDLTKKKKFKQLSVVLCLLLMGSLGVITILLWPREPVISFIKEDIQRDSEIVLFSREEIKKVYIEGEKLFVVLDVSIKDAGYYMEGSDEEVDISLFKFKNIDGEETVIPYDGIVDFDLSEYANLKRINVMYN